MQARDLMTLDVVSVSPDTPVREVARLLLTRHISAVPVIDGSGMVVGMVSEGDLIGRSDEARQARQDWWLMLLAEGETLSEDFLACLRHPGQTAHDVMSAPAIRVTENTEATEIAALLAQYRIKRVPVVRDGRIVGIVSRADLLRALAEGHAPRPAAEHVARARGLLAEAMATLDHRFFGHHTAPSAGAAAAGGHATAEGGLSVADFRGLVSGYEQHKYAEAMAARQAAVQRRSGAVKQLIDEHLGDENWNALLHRAREAAERGEREFQLLRFPGDLCSDGGRAVNAALPEWPQTLRGEAAEVYVRWQNQLKPRGFHLSARVLDFPGGKPGDIGLFLGWGE
jgi:CBS domain-containing protein